MRCAHWVAFLLVGQTGCQGRSTPSDDAKPKASASASVPAKSNAEPPLVPEEHRISIVAVPRPGSSIRDVVARVSAPPLEVKLAEVEASRRCGLAPVYRVERPGLPPSPGRGVMLTCDTDTSVPIIVEGDRLSLGETTHELGPGPIIYPEKVEGYEVVDCPTWKQKKRPLREIRVERREVVAPDPEAGQAYSLGVIVNDEYWELGRLPKVPMRCWSSHVSVDSDMLVECEFGERAISLLLGVAEDVFWIEWWDGEWLGGKVRIRFGWVVGCQHQMIFRRFFKRDRRFKQVPPGCVEQCVWDSDCPETCYRGSIDDRGVIITDRNEWCIERCDEAERLCAKRCADAGP